MVEVDTGDDTRAVTETELNIGCRLAGVELDTSGGSRRRSRRRGGRAVNGGIRAQNSGHDASEAVALSAECSCRLLGGRNVCLVCALLDDELERLVKLHVKQRERRTARLDRGQQLTVARCVVLVQRAVFDAEPVRPERQRAPLDLLRRSGRLADGRRLDFVAAKSVSYTTPVVALRRRRARIGRAGG